mmetsp:Transcript_50431/g.122334  ORF Transcript_50431/g.122334 Transcript_50431/m.122334 type:complete len:232 (+) Transcript_50431:340-1035(+)
MRSSKNSKVKTASLLGRKEGCTVTLSVSATTGTGTTTSSLVSEGVEERRRVTATRAGPEEKPNVTTTSEGWYTKANPKREMVRGTSPSSPVRADPSDVAATAVAAPEGSRAYCSELVMRVLMPALQSESTTSCAGLTPAAAYSPAYSGGRASTITVWRPAFAGLRVWSASSSVSAAAWAISEAVCSDIPEKKRDTRGSLSSAWYPAPFCFQSVSVIWPYTVAFFSGVSPPT